MPNVGKEAVELAASVGLVLDPWEAMVLEKSLTPRPDTYPNDVLGMHLHKYQAFEVGLVVSRQNGKGAILEARELAGLFLLGENLIMHSAHEFPTSLEAFRRILFWIENNDELRRDVKKVVFNHGEEGIELKNGQRLRFRTRTKGGGRGFTGDCLILDEAMILKQQAVASLLPTLSARPNPQIWYTGSAGDQESQQLGRVRKRAHLAIAHGPDTKQWDDRLLYFEWAADTCTEFCADDCEEHDDIDDVRTWAKTNPGLGIRISEEHIRAERRSMDRENFLRERLGVGDWPIDDEGWLIIPQEAWEGRGDESSVPREPLTFAVDVTPSLSHSAIVACGEASRDRVHVEITSTEEHYDHRQGTDWVVPRLVELHEKWKPEAVVIDKGTQAGRFVDELKFHGIEVISPTAREYAQACGAFLTSVVPQDGNRPNLVHINQPSLTKAVSGAATRKLADLWAWDKRSARQDISPLVAATLAKWGYMKVVTDAQSADPWMFYG
jgi:phage terminase large subunit-like protein